MNALLSLLAACTPSDDDGVATVPGDPTGTETADTATPVPTTPTTPTAATGDTAVTGPTGDTAAAPVDCSVLPPLPAPFVPMPAFDTNEDFDFDGAGYLCTNLNQNLACRDLKGNTKVAAPSIGLTSGIRVLPSGDWLINNQLTGSVVLVDGKTGGRTVVLSGVNYPNGLEVGTDGWVFVTEHGAGNVRQLDVLTMEQHVVVSGLNNPNGIILSPDEQTMYVASFGGGVVYAVDRIGPTDWDTPRIFHTAASGPGEYDGINVDICGNVYITEYTVGRVYRLTADGLGNGVVADFTDGWIPNLRWGHDIGGWDSSTLYVAAWDTVYALDMGIPGKRHVLAP